MTKLNPNGTRLWLDSDGDTCFQHEGASYKIVSINERNEIKLYIWRQKGLPLSTVRLDKEGADTYYCVLVSGTISTFLTPLEVVCIAERYQTAEQSQAVLNKFISAITETTLNKHDGKDYREIHPDGTLARGIKDGIPYQEVLDENGEATYMVLVKENGLVGMYFSEECYAVVEVGNGKDIEDAIREVKNKAEFVNQIRDDEEDANLSDDKVICDYAYIELACPRWAWLGNQQAGGICYLPTLL